MVFFNEWFSISSFALACLASFSSASIFSNFSFISSNMHFFLSRDLAAASLLRSFLNTSSLIIFLNPHEKKIGSRVVGPTGFFAHGKYFVQHDGKLDAKHAVSGEGGKSHGHFPCHFQGLIRHVDGVA